MAASQRKCSKQIWVVEKHLKRTGRDESSNAIINEYNQFLLEQIESEKQEGKTLISLEHPHEKVKNPSVLNSFLILQEQLQMYEKQLATLKDDIDNLTIQSIAEKESFKIQRAEKERAIKSFYISEEKRAMEELEKVDKECAKKEEEIKNQISLEVAAKNARLYEIKGNLQRQIIDKNDDFTKAQSEGRELRKQLEEIKSNMKQHPGDVSTLNIMKFQSSAPQDKQFALLNIPNVTPFSHYTNSEERSAQQNPLNMKSTRYLVNNVEHSSGEKENVAPNRLNAQIKDKKRLADEYKQFEKNFALSASSAAGPIIQKMKPNPCNIVANRDKKLQVKSVDELKPVMINKAEPYTDDLDETNFFAAIGNNDSTEDSAENAARKLPTVYGKRRKENRTSRQTNLLK